MQCSRIVGRASHRKNQNQLGLASRRNISYLSVRETEVLKYGTETRASSAFEIGTGKTPIL